MKFGSMLGWGVVIYAIMYLVWTGFILYGFAGNIAPRILGLLTLIAVALIAGRSLRFRAWQDVLPYSIAWAVVVAILDGVFSVPYSGWQLYSDWNVWVGYVLVVIVPLFAPYTRARIEG